ncbi:MULTISPECIES: beta-L-arabinofuranosidase domain-containing protein [unclassified Paenibacillus]|uniref:glycoside hydrolase family 127 protein n=1 Tax=unclassified Paenibacillus TaxID=185978 RepID=UPI001F3B7EAA|nr:beta-L-arabinofuranosidase domain-containing protein [Paenibacillus sp. JJ-223]CAH1210192.1 Non-reducing end beta-L-arabinofuranosidase [Paenibacillus sp. JJ-223]
MEKSDVSMPKQSRSYRNHINDPFWSPYVELVRNVVVPYQWEALNDRIEGAEPSRAIRNFRIAAGEEEGEFHGMVFQDSDVAKWIEASSYLLAAKADEVLEQQLDEVIHTIACAQQPDGYLNTYFTLKEPGQRWTNLAECHELYCAGHMIEAGVAHYEATGKRTLLDVVVRLADHIVDVFGPKPGQLQGYDGHQEIELALFKLYKVTGNATYLDQCLYFLDQRGQRPHYFVQEWEKRGKSVHFGGLDMVHHHEYSQSHLPVREQDAAVGHAVRLVYMCSATADAAAETGDESLKQACRRLWNSIVGKRMYITGSIGSSAKEEAFTGDYDLPGDTAYAETCASIGLMFFACRMLNLEANSIYADVMERALYNTVISGMSLDGRRFFYVNPLEVHPHLHHANPNYSHVRSRRQGWFGCACCPPNIARLLASLDQYVYTVSENESTLHVQLYIGGEGVFCVNGNEIHVQMESDYASQGKVTMRFTPQTSHDVHFILALRKPGWSGTPEISINGELDPSVEMDEDGYIRLERLWAAGDEVQILFPMHVLRMKGHEGIQDTFGRVAVQRGPFMYCLEEADNGEGLYRIYLPRENEFRVGSGQGNPMNVPDLTIAAKRMQTDEAWGGQLYRSDAKWGVHDTDIRLIPYFTWANREEGEMRVWIHEWHGDGLH